MEYSKSSDLLCTFQKHDALENWILPPCPSVTTLVRISVFIDKTEPSKQDSIHEFLRNNFPVGFQSLHQTQNPHRVQNRFGNKLVYQGRWSSCLLLALHSEWVRSISPWNIPSSTKSPCFSSHIYYKEFLTKPFSFPSISAHTHTHT
jgi:hypothetical protein